MIEEIFQLSPLALGAIPLVVGLVQVAKGLKIPAKLAPLVSIAFGIGILAISGIAWQAFVIQGLIVGLSASGLYSGGKKVLNPAG